MTEYDYSPGAMEAYMKKQAGIDRWRHNNSHHTFVNPFQQTPSAHPDASEFYRKKSKKRSSSHRKSKSGGRGGRYDSESSDSEYGGPDRPPTPPATAPAFGGVYVQHPRHPQAYAAQYAQPQVQYNALPKSPPAVPYAQKGQPPPPIQLFNHQTGTPMVPMWNGSCWVYHAAPTVVSPAASSSSQRRSKSGDGGRSSKHRSTASGAYYQPQVQAIHAAQQMQAQQQYNHNAQIQAQWQAQYAARNHVYSASMPNMSTLAPGGAVYLPASGHTSPTGGVYQQLPQGYAMAQMPAGYVNGQPVAPAADKKSSGSSFFGRLKKKKT